MENENKTLSLILEKLKKLNDLDQKFDSIDKRFDTIDQKFNASEIRFAKLDNKVTVGFKDLKLEFEKSNYRIRKLEKGQGRIEHKLEDIDSNIKYLWEDVTLAHSKVSPAKNQF